MRKSWSAAQQFLLRHGAPVLRGRTAATEPREAKAPEYGAVQTLRAFFLLPGSAPSPDIS